MGSFGSWDWCAKVRDVGGSDSNLVVGVVDIVVEVVGPCGEGCGMNRLAKPRQTWVLLGLWDKSVCSKSSK